MIAEEAKKSAVLKTKAEIVIGTEKVKIGDKVYKIITNTAKGKTYRCIRTTVNGRQQSLNLDVLEGSLK